MKPSIGVIGTGRMGSALARTLIDAEYRTTVWNRTREKAEALAASGARLGVSVADTVKASEIVIINVSDYAATAQLVENEYVVADLAGRIVVELSSGTPHGARNTAQYFRKRNVRYLDGAILASPDLIGTTAGTILVAGPHETFLAAEPVLRALSPNTEFVGDDPGLVNALDSAVLALMWGALFGALQAIAVCQEEGIALGDLGRHWAATTPVIGGLVADLINRTDARRFVADAATLASVSPHYSAFGHLLELMEERKIDRTIANAYGRIFKQAIAAGHLHDDFAALSQFMRAPD